jgi:two-component system response regulator AtoC
MNKAAIVIVDDDAPFRLLVARSLGSAGHTVDTLPDGSQLLARLKAGLIPSVILLDVVLAGEDGIQLIGKIKAIAPHVPVIMLSGVDHVRTVVEAMKLGAADFLIKPFEESGLHAAVKNCLAAPAARVEALSGEFVSANARMLRLADIVRRVADTDVPILLLGESGVGKEVMARYAHLKSGRGSKPFVKVNCAALPTDLLESELFGHEQGAFTGALTSRAGKFEQAHTGTLLLDEIGEMTSHMQSKLLHVLQDGTFSRLGGRKSIQVDARIIASTNVKIEEAIASGKFREDLYFRLSVISLDLPPLRERREDIPGLCAYFIEKYRDRYNSDARELSPELSDCFVRYDWPGNVRQLENFIKRFLVLPDQHSLMSEFNHAETDVIANDVEDIQSTSLLDVGANAADQAERELVRQVLLETHGNRKQAARRMNICYKALLNKLKRWNVPLRKTCADGMASRQTYGVSTDHQRGLRTI